MRATLFVCLTLAALSSSGCGPTPTRCQTRASCPTGYVCAQTDAPAMKVCVQLPPVTPRLARLALRPVTRQPLLPKPTTPTDDVPTAPAPMTDCIAPPLKPGDLRPNGGRRVRLDELDRAVFRMLRKVYYASRRCHERIWGGRYKMHQIPTYLVNVGRRQPGGGRGIRGFLLHYPKPPRGAVLVDSRLTQGIQGVYLYQGHRNSIAQSGFDFALAIGDIKVYAMAYGTQDSFDPRRHEYLRFFVHEGFHRAQEYEDAWKPAKGDQDIKLYSYDPLDLARILLEHRILMGAMYKDKSTSWEALKRFYALRTIRILQDRSGRRLIENYDNYQEYLEGTSMYAESAFSAAVGIPLRPKDLNSIYDRLITLEKLGLKGDATFLKESIKARAYGTGAALGLLLDQAGDTQWKDSLRAGKTLYQHLHSIFGAEPLAKQAAWIAEAKRRHNFSQLQPLAQRFATKIATLPPDDD